ncbi:hypothetical protein OG946_20120 [Streptomyces sp. NBC_01808]|uniref:hypothetical protein n=1 Tax=Streptomyces sp. NBC_01808 TaxID=2975947 RepID=UPI002DDA96CD|nr:hypothetical protein [Streptomyces sp. NBC_01808]WSA39462.1 hypothetical protein OG946_20120 [Streptomyces sp. NBC_01808]
MTTHPSPSDPAAVALELERLRRSVEVGFARADGSLALLVQRSDATERQLAELAGRLDTVDSRLDTVERGETERQKRDTARLDAVERRMWPLPSVAALVAACGLALTLWQLATR